MYRQLQPRLLRRPTDYFDKPYPNCNAGIWEISKPIDEKGSKFGKAYEQWEYRPGSDSTGLGP